MLTSVDKKYEERQNKQLVSIWIMMWILFGLLVSIFF